MMGKKKPVYKAFLNEADELNQLGDIVEQAIGEGLGPMTEIRVKRTLRRFRSLLANAGLDNGSIMLQDHWALLCEAEGDVPQAIKHREEEVGLIERLFDIGGPVGSVDLAFLAQTLQKLQRDYVHAGEKEKAAATSERIRLLES